MKKLFVVFILLLFILSSCGYTSEYIDELQEKWNSEYFDLEEKYFDVCDRAEALGFTLSHISESYATAYCYYDDADPDVTESEAHAALLKIGEYLRDAGY